MKQFNFSNFEKVVERFKGKRLLVIGDLLLDQYSYGDVSRISPEAPVPVVWIQKEDLLPGGACNVAANLSELGAEVSMLGVVGRDKTAETLMTLLEDNGIHTDGVICDEKRKTSLKTRVIAHNQQVVRIDREDVGEVDGKYLEAMKRYIEGNIENFDGIIIEDYGKGVISPGLIKMVVKLAEKQNKIVAVDPKESHFSFYKGVSVITPNHHEASRAVGFPVVDDKSREKAGTKLLKNNNADVILLTLGEEGMMVFEKGKSSEKIPTVAREVYDVSGAGDTVIAVYTLSVVSGGSPLIAAHLANCAAGIVVGRVGASAVYTNELLESLKPEIF